MLLKTIIIVLLIGLIISLGSGLVFLFKDVGTTRRTLHSLGVRITLAVALMATILYGFFSGQLKMGAPWDARKFVTPQELKAGQPPAESTISDSADANPTLSNDVDEEE